jgi:hypothetical protein
MTFTAKKEPLPDGFRWSEKLIGAALSKMFEGKFMMAIPTCGWTGHECDLLAVTKDMRIIDVEIKISRSDFRADFDKEKWYYTPMEAEAITGTSWQDYWLRKADRVRRPWPRKVWKHYYCLPKSIWTDGMADQAGSMHSGIILLDYVGGQVVAELKRIAKPDRAAEILEPEHVLTLARHASLRMWDAYRKLEAGS